MQKKNHTNEKKILQSKLNATQNSYKKYKKFMTFKPSLCFLRRAQKLTKSSPSIWRLLSKCQIDGEDFVIFGGLLRKHEL